MLKKVCSTLRKFNMLTPGDTVLIGVSGGPDSTALLFALKELREEWKTNLIIVHVNHNLRGEASNGDARFVANLADQLGFACYIKEADVKSYWKNSGLSKQAAARELRYRLLEETAAEVGANRIALGHNANDQLETVLMNFLKGAGMEGLSGIPPVRGCYIRPLIEIPREVINDYCRYNQLNPIIDETNLEPIYLRNKIRLELVPLLEREYNPALLQGALRLTEVLREEDELLAELTSQAGEEVVETRKNNQIRLMTDKLIPLPMALQRRIIRQIWRKLTGHTQGLHFTHLEDILTLAREGKNGSSLDLAGGFKVNKSYNRLVFGHNEVSKAAVSFQYPLKISGRTEIPEIARVIESRLISREELSHSYYGEGFQAYLDWEAMEGVPLVRQRKDGDRFQPLGAPGTKKLKDYFIDKKVPRRERDTVPVVCFGEKIVWIAGYTIADQYKVKEETEKILYLELI